MVFVYILMFILTSCTIASVIIINLCVNEIKQLKSDIHSTNREIADNKSALRYILEEFVSFRRNANGKINDINERLDAYKEESVETMKNVGRDLIKINNYMSKLRIEARKARNMSVFEGAKENKEPINDMHDVLTDEMKEGVVEYETEN